MKKHKLLTAILAGFVFLTGCKKEETVVQPYTPPQPKLYGTWRILPGFGSEGYFAFPDDGSSYAHILQIDQYGFKTKSIYAYSATDKQIVISGSVFNYTVNQDTLKLNINPSSGYTMVKETDPAISYKTWLTPASILKSINSPRGVGSGVLSFGIDGNDLYLSAYNGSYYAYKFNTISGDYSDSVIMVNEASLFHKSGSLYYGFNNMSNKIFKGNIFSSVNPISTNNLSNVRAISANPNSGVVYAFCSDGKVYSGTDNSTFNALFDLSSYSVNSVVYYKNDEFLCIRSSSVHRVQMTPEFKVLATYEIPKAFSAYTVSTNGTDTYVFGYDNASNKHAFMKISL